MKVSIVLTAYRRAGLLNHTLASIAEQTHKDIEVIVVEDGRDGGPTEETCRQSPIPVKYICRVNRPRTNFFSNPSVPKNIGIKAATGEILIVQCAEVMYTTPNDIANLIQPVERDPWVSSFALAKALNKNGDFEQWYAGPDRCAGWFLDFCQAVRREHVVAIQGFDEGYEGYGFEDDDFSLRLQSYGVKYQWNSDVIVHHQWHEIYDKNPSLSEFGRARYDRVKFEIENHRRGPVANIERRQWGSLSS